MARKLLSGLLNVCYMPDTALDHRNIEVSTPHSSPLSINASVPSALLSLSFPQFLLLQDLSRPLAPPLPPPHCPSHPSPLPLIGSPNPDCTQILLYSCVQRAAGRNDLCSPCNSRTLSWACVWYFDYFPCWLYSVQLLLSFSNRSPENSHCKQ